MEEQKTISIIGSLNRLIYENDTFKIAQIYVKKVEAGRPAYNDDGHTITLTGDMSIVSNYDYIIECEYSVHPKYGPQYKLITSRLDRPIETMSASEFRDFLVSVNPSKAFKINKMYPDSRELFEKQDKKALMKIPGIGPKTVESLLLQYNEQRDFSTAFAIFGQWGFTKAKIKEIVRNFNSLELAIEKFKKNPYVLMKIPGIGFKTIDDKAREKGIAENDPRRVKAYLIDYFQNLAEDGSSYTDIDSLKDHLRKKIFDCNIVDTFAMLNKDDKFIVYKAPEGIRIALRTYYDMEKYVARNLKRIAEADSKLKLDGSDQIIKNLQDEQGWEYSTEQLAAINQLLKENVVLLRGPGGVGKTTVLKAIVTVMKEKGYSIATCALAGKAADNLTKVTGLRSATIHSLLLSHREGINEDVVIVDEISMVDVTLFAKLVGAISKGTKLIMVGDSAQLDAIGIGVMKGILNSNKLTVVTLNKIHRQAKNSAIITHSLQFRSGNIPTGLSQKSNWHMMGRNRDLGYVLEENENDILKDTKRVFKYVINSYSITDVQILSPTVRVCDKLNAYAQNIVNPDKGQPSVQMYPKLPGAYTLRVGDKVINTKNNRHTCDPSGTVEIPIFNGNTGIIESIESDNAKTEVIINFDGIGRVQIDKSDLSSIRLGYAITVHKSQGSTIPCVIIALPFQYMLNSRELLYTAITRASEKCYVVSSMKTLRSTVKKTSSVIAKTNLEDFLKGAL